MRKIFLNLFLMVSMVAFTACGGDDTVQTPTPFSNGALIVDIDGVTTTFNTFTILEKTSISITIAATIDDGISKIITFEVIGNGTNALTSMRYRVGGVSFVSTGFTANVTTHTTSNLIGVFEGEFLAGGSSHNLTNGSFNYTN